MGAGAADLIGLLDLESIEQNLFRGYNQDDFRQRVYGGQVIGQALVAASRTVEGRLCHSLHAYFLRAGDPRVPILYEVDRARDGRSFTARRVVAIQHSRQIFNMAVSFQVAEEGLEHQDVMPRVPDPDALASNVDLVKRVQKRLRKEHRDPIMRDRPVELRPVDPIDPLDRPRRAPAQNVWFRAKGPVPDDPVIQQSVLAYMSDFTLLDTATHPHGVHFLDPRIQVASLDHAIWFHRPFRVHQWLLYAQDSPSACGARGFARGRVFDRDGRLVASVAQEGLIRLHPSPSP